MKISSFALAFALSTVFSIVAFAAPSYLPVPHKVGPAQTPIYYAAPQAQVLKKTQAHTFYTLDAILKWGVHVFEKGQLVYRCENVRKACSLINFKGQESYAKCTLHKGQAQCFDSLEAQGSSSSEEGDSHLDPATPFKEMDGKTDENSPQFEESPSSEDSNPHFDEAPAIEPSEAI